MGRTAELTELESWWSTGRMTGLVWGRRRVGKTVLIRQFSNSKRTVFHTGTTRSVAEELRVLSRRIAEAGLAGLRDLGRRPFADWDDALEALAAAAQAEPILLVLDEFPELMKSQPSLPSVLRAFLDHSAGKTKLRILICGSAVRVMQELQESREPLYGRFDLTMHVHPLPPSEVGLMLPTLSPSERARVWGVLGGIPLYLEWWDASASFDDNLIRLFGSPGARLLDEGELILATESDLTGLAPVVLQAIAAGKTKYSEIRDEVGAVPDRTLDRLIQLRLVERMVPATEDPARSRRRLYRISDNFLAFWLAVVQQYRSEIERGLGRSIASAIAQSIDDFMGFRWEEAVRTHVRRMIAERRLVADAVAVGSYWDTDGSNELDVIVLSGRERKPTLIGEAKWARSVDARRLERTLTTKAHNLGYSSDIQLLIAARDEVTNASDDVLTITANQIFGD